MSDGTILGEGGSAASDRAAGTRFGSFGELREAHLAFIRDGSGEGDFSSLHTADAIQAFLDKAAATGVIVADSDERRLAQRILDYWSAELISHSSARRRDAGSVRLASYAETHAEAVQPSLTAQNKVDPLDAQTRAQIRLAATARLWLDSKRDPGYLLTGKAVIEAAALRETDPNIDLLVTASEAAQFKRRLIFGVAAVGIATFIALRFGSDVYDGFTYIYTWQYRNTVLESDTETKEKADPAKPNPIKLDAIKKIGDVRGFVSLSREKISDLNLYQASISYPLYLKNSNITGLQMGGTRLLGGSEGIQADFSNSVIDQSRFRTTILNGVSFSGIACEIKSTSTDRTKETSFEGANLSRAKFSGCKIDKVIFSNANLSNADFSSSTISSSKFDGANLAGADFTGVRLKPEDKSFANTAWWLAHWDVAQVKALELAYPHDKIRDNKAFRLESLRLEYEVYRAEAVANTQPEILLVQENANAIAAAYNALAWQKVINGFKLPDAKDEAQKALDTILQLKSKSNPAYSFSIIDTIGYILLQDRKYSEAAEKYESVDGQDGMQRASGGTQYRYALALVALGRKEEAKKFRKNSEAADYVPTHELVLVPDWPVALKALGQ